MHIFYCPDIENNILDEVESAHAVKVLRLRERDIIQIVDGKGSFCKAEISNAHPKKCEFTIIEKKEHFELKNYYIHIAIAPTKNMDRIEWLVEKCTEIGINEISFIQCAASERKHINTDRLSKLVISAMKQSIKAYLPVINEMIPFKKFIEQSSEELKFIAHLANDNRKDLKSLALPGKKYCILIGPEGDFSPEEIELALQKGFQPVTLGTSRLRTETAGMVTCNILNIVND